MSKASNIPMPLGPDSYTWQDFGSYLFHLMLPQAFVLQSAHPVIDAAVGKDKKYKVDPWGRAKNSTKLLWPVVYARPQKAIDMGIALRELHREIKGVDKNGKRYFALDPEAYSWVHYTGFDATLRMYEYFDKPVTTEQRQRLFQEWLQLGKMLGVDKRQLPENETEYWEHFNDIIENRLIYGEVIQDLLDPNHYQNYPRPDNMKYLPKALWKAMMWLPGRFFHKLSIATLPRNFRERFDIPFSKADERLFILFAKLVKVVYPLLPEAMRYIPLAQRARKDARQHPAAYRLDNITQANSDDSEMVNA